MSHGESESRRNDLMWGAIIALLGGLFVNLPNVITEVNRDTRERRTIREAQVTSLSQVRSEISVNAQKLVFGDYLDTNAVLDPPDNWYLSRVSLGRLKAEFGLSQYQHSSWDRAKSVKGMLETNASLWGDIESFYTKLNNIYASLDGLFQLWEANLLETSGDSENVRMRRAQDVSQILCSAFPRAIHEMSSIRREALGLCDSIDQALDLVRQGQTANTRITVSMGRCNGPVVVSGRTRGKVPAVTSQIEIQRITLVLNGIQFFSKTGLPCLEKPLGPLVVTVGSKTPSFLIRHQLVSQQYSRVMFTLDTLSTDDMNREGCIPDKRDLIPYSAYRHNLIAVGVIRNADGTSRPFVYRVREQRTYEIRGDFTVTDNQPLLSLLILPLNPASWFADSVYVLDPTSSSDSVRIHSKIAQSLNDKIAIGWDRNNDGEADPF
jgi:hypothetical protein